MLSNPGYYEQLKQQAVNYPSPAQQQIEVDLRRTYPDETSVDKLEQDIIPLRNVLCAFVSRC